MRKSTAEDKKPLCTWQRRSLVPDDEMTRVVTLLISTAPYCHTTVDRTWLIALLCFVSAQALAAAKSVEGRQIAG
eukprot:scaffold22078_cov84-Skeletonema_dohrnii-CCMP3373.AAC.4